MDLGFAEARLPHFQWIIIIFKSFSHLFPLKKAIVSGSHFPPVFHQGGRPKGRLLRRAFPGHFPAAGGGCPRCHVHRRGRRGAVALGRHGAAGTTQAGGGLTLGGISQQMVIRHIYIYINELLISLLLDYYYY